MRKSIAPSPFNPHRESPLYLAFRKIRDEHPEINSVLATYVFDPEKPKGCPYRLNLNELFNQK